MINPNTMQAMFLIKEFYANRTTKRHAIPLMDHIEHGVKVLKELGASDAATAAFALHPMFQDDEALQENELVLHALDPFVVALVMEYRNIANQGLRGKTPPSEISIPLVEVRQMLIADKVQNRYSFLKYHKNTHPHAAVLNDYFDAWLAALGVDAARYESLVATFNEPQGEPQHEQLRRPPAEHTA